MQSDIDQSPRQAARRSTSAASEPSPSDVEVHQATGMVSVQLDCTVDDALLALITRAVEQGRSLEALAHDVVTRTFAFDAGGAATDEGTVL